MKLLSLLLALVMAFGMMTVMASASSSDVTLGSGRNGVTIQFGTPASYANGLAPAYDTATKIVGEDGFYQRLPVYGNAQVKYRPDTWAIPRTGSVTVSEEGIIDDFSFTLGKWAGTPYGGNICLQFNYTALKAGTVTVTVKYYYRFASAGSSWYGETATFTVNVKEDDVEIDPATKPAQPSEDNHDFDDLWSADYGAVMLECGGKDWYNHSAFWTSFDDAENGYSLSEVKENDGSVSNAPKSKWPWMCEMTIHVDAWLKLYNDNYAEECGAHVLQSGSDTDFVIKWFWNGTKWTFAPNNHIPSKGNSCYVSLWITEGEPAATEYTVTYTDGVNGAAFADQTHTVKDGDATPAFDGTPAREGYVFLGWEPEVAETVTGNATYTAQWEEALTEVKVTSNRKEGALLFLGDEIKVTAKANTAATITITPTLNGAFKQIASDTAADGTKTIWYRVTKIIGNYTTLNFKATATKGTQEPVTGELTYGVNLRNRIHVTVKMASDNSPVTDAEIRLMHKYPQWNACPALKYDSAKGEYVMANEWDLSSQEFWQVEIKVGDDTFYIDTDKFGKNLLDVVRTGEEEIYVEYVIVDPITVNIYVNGVNVGSKEYKGSQDQKLDFNAFQAEALANADVTLGNLGSLTIENDNTKDDTGAIFGKCTEVNVRVTTK